MKARIILETYVDDEDDFKEYLNELDHLLHMYTDNYGDIVESKII